MVIKSKHQLAKEQALNRKERRFQKELDKKNYNSLSEKEKLKILIDELKIRIKNVERDLNGIFKGNIAITGKLKRMLGDLANKEALYKTL